MSRCSFQAASLRRAVKLVYNAESRMKELHQAVEYEVNVCPVSWWHQCPCRDAQQAGVHMHMFLCDLYRYRSALQAQQRKELTEFTSLELSAVTEAECVLAANLSDANTQLTRHATALSSTEAELKGTQAALAQAEEEVSLLEGLLQVTEHVTASDSPAMASRGSHCERLYVLSDQSVVMSAQVQHLRFTHSSCEKAAEKAQMELKILRGTCQQLTHDRMQSISNVRKAESEVGQPCILSCCRARSGRISILTILWCRDLQCYTHTDSLLVQLKLLYTYLRH